MRILAATTVLLALVGSASAQPQREANCQAGSGAAHTMSDPKAAVAKIATDCSTGDVIFVPGGSVYVVLSVCDFSKAIPALGNGKIACALKLPPRPQKGS